MFLLPRKGRAATATTIAITDALKTFLPSVEGFSSTPYWDHKQWSWGYGTRVPGSTADPNKKPPGTITRAQAFNDMIAHVQKDYYYLLPLVKRPLNANQWAAFLSFSYNLGTGNADNLITNINSGDDAALFAQWMKYVYASGERNAALIVRREKEIALWQS